MWRLLAGSTYNNASPHDYTTLRQGETATAMDGTMACGLPLNGYIMCHVFRGQGIDLNYFLSLHTISPVSLVETTTSRQDASRTASCGRFLRFVPPQRDCATSPR